MYAKFPKTCHNSESMPILELEMVVGSKFCVD